MMEEEYLTKRIQKIVDTCPKTKDVYEIGCDHGYITMSLLLTGKAKNVVATDISMDAITKAILNCQKKKLLPFISFRQGDGFQAYTKYDRATLGVISGIGGNEIVKILGKVPEKINDLVISPTSDIYNVRNWLVHNGFKIDKDFLFEDRGQYYTVIYATRLKASEKYTVEPLYLYYGKDNFEDEEYKEEFIKYLKSEEERIIGLFKKLGEISVKLNEKYQIITESLSRLGIELLPIA